MDVIKNNLIFLREFLQEFESTGSICPTSKWAAEALIGPLLGKHAPKRILEAGPGTGSVTLRILEQLNDQDELVICELNPRFMQALKKNLRDNPNFIRHQSRIKFFQCPVQELPDSGKFDLIVCAIPFLNLGIKTVKEIFAKFEEMSHAETALTYYEYIGMKEISEAVSPERRKRLRELEDFFTDIKDQHDTSRKRIWLNLFPINVYKIDGIAA